MDPTRSDSTRSDYGPTLQQTERNTTSWFWRAALYHLALAARVNGLVVFPVSCLLLGLAPERNWPALRSILLIVVVLTNCNFALLTAFYHGIWKSAPLRGWRAHLTLGTLVLPALGILGAMFGAGVLDLIGPAGSPDVRGLLWINVSAVVVYGVSLYTIEDSRRHHGRVLMQLEGSQRREDEAERARRYAEATALQALINPHFVFNTLNAIATVIHEDQDKAEELTLRLARLLRHVLELREGTLISLATEMEIARSYLEIEKVRLGKRLQYSLDIPESLLQVAIPGMLLQPLVENAIKHGVRERPAGGSVRVLAHADDHSCYLEIIDDGPGFRSNSGGGHGLRLVRGRLDHAYGPRYELRVERLTRREETIVTLRFPLASHQAAVA